jgi:hypothetical protein
MFSSAVALRAALHFAFGINSGKLLAAALQRSIEKKKIQNTNLQQHVFIDGGDFVRALGLHVLFDVSAAIVDESSSYLQNKLSVQLKPAQKYDFSLICFSLCCIRWSKSISNRLMTSYFSRSFFYNSKCDGRILDADVRVLEAKELAESLSAVFASSLPPLLDLALFGTSV